MWILQGLLTSVLIHLILLLVLEKVPLPAPINKQAIEFEVAEVPQNKTSEKQIVRDSLLPEKYKVKESDDPLRFLSEKAQRVKQQTKAALSGLTQNRDGKSKKSASSVVDPFGTTYKPRPNLNAGNDSGFSTISDSLDEVSVGTMTALNTDQYLFYSFFNRVSELVYFRWTNLVRNAQDRVAQRLANRTVNSRWVTQIDIWLKPNGEFHSAHLLKPSGVPEFDRAATLAFQQAGLFPNPPKEMVEDDGFIHLRYGLTVNFDPKVLVVK